MALYIPPAFAPKDEARALELVEAHPFATLVTARAGGGEPHVTHLPLLLEGRALLGHMARPNPHGAALAAGRTVAIFHGPHAYVSPRWYESPADNVPTWNYAVVHASVRHAPLDDAALRELMERLTARFDPQAPRLTEPRMQSLVKGIAGFRLDIERLDVKFKMSQNKSAADRAGVIAALRASGPEADRAVADWMARHD